MNGFRLFLMVYCIALIAYSATTMVHHGPNLLPIFFRDIAAMAWPGQFNFDFLGFLSLSAMWTAWRNGFTLAGMGLAVLAFFGGMLFLSIYLLILSYQTNGDLRQMLVGARSSGA